MTRTEAIAIINAKLPSLADEAVMTVAGIVQELDAAPTVRRFSERERELIEQSKADFREGRSYSIEEARARSDAFLKSLRAKYPTAP